MSNCKTIAVCNQKGGVGKTTTTVNLGVGLAMQGKKVLLIDADPQGDLTTCLGWRDSDSLSVTLTEKLQAIISEQEQNPFDGILHHKEKVDLVPSNLSLSSLEMTLVTAMSRESVLKNYLSLVKDKYDYVLIDCMPSLGMITFNALTAADSVIIPVQAQYLPAKGMTQLLGTIAKVRKHTNADLKIDGILLTLVDGRTNLAKSTVEALRENFGSHIRIYRSMIPAAVKAAEVSSKGTSSVLLIFAPHFFAAIFTEGEAITTVPVFNLEQWGIVLPVFVISLLIGLVDEILRLIIGVYCKLVMISNIVCGVLQIALSFVVLKVLPIWNPNFAFEIEQVLGDNADSGAKFLTYWNTDMVSKGLLVFIVVITLFEIGVTIYKTHRYGASVKNGKNFSS